MTDIVVPELSESVVEATVAEWLVKVGDQVSAGDVLVVLETDKVSLEVAAEMDGVISEIVAGEDEDVAAGAVLGRMQGESGAAAPSAPAKTESAQPAPEPQPAAQASSPAPAPQSTPKPAPSSANGGSAVKATPVARRMAEGMGINLAQVRPSGDKIEVADVEAYVSKLASGQASAPAAPPANGGSIPAPQRADAEREHREKMSRRRRTIAKRLVQAQSEAAMLTTFNEFDMSAIMELRSRRKDAFKEKYEVSLGLSSFFVKAVVGALKAFPRLNAEIEGDFMILKQYYDIGIAIGAEEGLIVPVLRDADKLSFAEIEKQIRLFASQANEGTLSLDALQGGSFTITNGGVFGSLMSTPILNAPQVGILGLHGIQDRPVAIHGEIVIRPMMYAAVTYDHRIVDGREAVQFLVKIKQLVEDPESLLIEG